MKPLPAAVGPQPGPAGRLPVPHPKESQPAMNNPLPKLARYASGRITASLNALIVTASSAAGGYIGAAAAPPSWTPLWPAAAGVGGLALALLGEQLARPLLWPHRPHLAHPLPLPAPDTGHVEEEEPTWPPQDILATVRQAACADAASRAAASSWQIDYAQTLLDDPDRWCGFEDGTAVCHLAPGARLRYHPADDSPEYTFERSTADTPTTVTSMSHLRELLANHLHELTDGTRQHDLQTA
jgi:hypothetical protein